MALKVLGIAKGQSAFFMRTLVWVLLPGMLASDMPIELIVGRVCVAAVIADIRIFVALF